MVVKAVRVVTAVVFSLSACSFVALQRVELLEKNYKVQYGDTYMFILNILIQLYTTYFFHRFQQLVNVIHVLLLVFLLGCFCPGGGGLVGLWFLCSPLLGPLVSCPFLDPVVLFSFSILDFCECNVYAVESCRNRPFWGCNECLQVVCSSICRDANKTCNNVNISLKNHC